MIDSGLKKIYNTRTRVLWHILFWLCFLLYQAIILGSIEGRSYLYEMGGASMDLPVQMITTYFTIYVLIPYFFLKKQFNKFVLAFIFTLVAAAFLNRAMYLGLYKHVLGFYSSSTEPFFNLPRTLKMIFTLYPVVVLGAFIKVGRIWLKNEQYNQQLKHEKLESELKHLKAQVQPHFLFNTLNNLYALTIKNSAKAGEVVLKLSDMLDYLLYEGNQREVALMKELDLLSNYIALEKIRYGDRLEISYINEGVIEGKKIPPLLLLPFVENSFKHGASKLQEDAWIKIVVRVENNVLHFNVSNNKKKDVYGVEVTTGKCLGLENVKKRLDILFRENYSLTIDKKENLFQIDLVLSMDKVYTPKQV